jgi:hypothetical protein
VLPERLSPPPNAGRPGAAASCPRASQQLRAPGPTFVPEDATWAEADTFARDPAEEWYRRPADGEPRELTYVDEDTFWAEF